MAADILEQAEPYIREVIRICGVLNIDGKELDYFNELVQRASKRLLRRSSRHAGQKKRNWENSLALKPGMGRSRKKLKHAVDKPKNECATNLPATPESVTPESAIHESAIDESVTSESVVGKPATYEPPTNNLTNEDPVPNRSVIHDRHVGESIHIGRDQPGQHITNEVMPQSVLGSEMGENRNTTIEPGEVLNSTMSLAEGISILDEYFIPAAADLPVPVASTECYNFDNAIAWSTNGPYASCAESSEVDGSNCTTGAPGILSSDNRITETSSVIGVESADFFGRIEPCPSAKRPVLDNSNLWLEDVVEVIPDSVVATFCQKLLPINTRQWEKQIETYNNY